MWGLKIMLMGFFSLAVLSKKSLHSIKEGGRRRFWEEKLMEKGRGVEGREEILIFKSFAPTTF